MSDTLPPRTTGGEEAPPSGDPFADPFADPLPDPAVSAQTPAGAGAGTSASRTEEVACPECGTRATVTLSRRESVDFCVRCDYPLFWSPQSIQFGDRDTDQATLRRLPGTSGKVTTASATCPHCDEANPLTALTCTRCGLPMVIVDVAPPPVVVPPPPTPVVVPAPPPPPPSRTWWWIVLGAATAIMMALLVWWLIVRQ